MRSKSRRSTSATAGRRCSSRDPSVATCMHSLSATACARYTWANFEARSLLLPTHSGGHENEAQRQLLSQGSDYGGRSLVQKA